MGFELLDHNGGMVSFLVGFFFFKKYIFLVLSKHMDDMTYGDS